MAESTCTESATLLLVTACGIRLSGAMRDFRRSAFTHQDLPWSRAQGVAVVITRDALRGARLRVLRCRRVSSRIWLTGRTGSSSCCTTIHRDAVGSRPPGPHELVTQLHGVGPRQGKPAVYVMTNSRSLAPQDAEERNRQVPRSAFAAAEKVGRSITFVSRSDCTLRGHFPLETDVLAEEILAHTGIAVDGVVIVPAFGDAGRITWDPSTAQGLSPTDIRPRARPSSPRTPHADIDPPTCATGSRRTTHDCWRSRLTRPSGPGIDCSTRSARPLSGRSSARSFTRLSGHSRSPRSARADSGDDAVGGLIVVGSHVAGRAVAALARGNVVVRTSRSLVTGSDAADSLAP
jgi:hypothetical protein